MQYKRTLLALCVEESLRNVFIPLEILLAMHLVSRLKHSLKDTASPLYNQLLASSYQQSSTQALAPEKERLIDLISLLAGNKNCDNEGNLNLWKNRK